MQRSHKEAVSVVLSAFMAAYPNLATKLSERTLEIWARLLADLPPEAIKQAGLELLMESKVPALPGIGELRRRALAQVNPAYQLSAEEAWCFLRQNLAYSEAQLPCGIRQSAREGLAPVLVEMLLKAGRQFGWENFEQGGLSALQEFRRVWGRLLEEQEQQLSRERLRFMALEKEEPLPLKGSP